MKKLIINVKLINKCKYKKGRIEKKDKSNKKKKEKIIFLVEISIPLKIN